MHARFFLAAVLTVLPALFQPAAFPPRFEWQHRSPEQAGMDPGKIKEAIAYHQADEAKAPRDMRRAHDLTFAREAYGEPLGPFQPPGEPTGVIVRHGLIVAEWGEPVRVDMTHSVDEEFSFDRRRAGLRWWADSQ